jgi:hypothetical protein
MDELIKLVSQKTSLPEDKVRPAVETVLNYLKSKLPNQFASHIDSAAQGQSIGGDALKDLGDLLGRKV